MGLDGFFAGQNERREAIHMPVTFRFHGSSSNGWGQGYS